MIPSAFASASRKACTAGGLFVAAGVSPENVSCAVDKFSFNTDTSPSDVLETFKNFYGPTMNAFAAAEANGKEKQLYAELEELFNNQNSSKAPGTTSITANYLKVTVVVG